MCRPTGSDRSAVPGGAEPAPAPQAGVSRLNRRTTRSRSGAFCDRKTATRMSPHRSAAEVTILQSPPVTTGGLLWTRRALGMRPLFLLGELVHNLVFVGKLPRLELGVDQVAVNLDFETAAFAGNELHVL